MLVESSARAKSGRENTTTRGRHRRRLPRVSVAPVRVTGRHRLAALGLMFAAVCGGAMAAGTSEGSPLSIVPAAGDAAIAPTTIALTPLGPTAMSVTAPAAGTTDADDPTIAPPGTELRPAPFTIALPDQRAKVALDTAMAQIGLPYVWGGNGPAAGDAGFDCSGLTTFAYAAAKVNLPRTAHTQYYTGPHVPKDAPLHPGDLLFYGVPSRVHHVGMYIGEGRMVNAPTFGKPVQVAFYRWNGDDYLGATRPAAIGTPSTGLLPYAPPAPRPVVPTPDDFTAPPAPLPATPLPAPTDPQPPESASAAAAIAAGPTITVPSVTVPVGGSVVTGSTSGNSPAPTTTTTKPSTSTTTSSVPAPTTTRTTTPPGSPSVTTPPTTSTTTGTSTTGTSTTGTSTTGTSSTGTSTTTSSGSAAASSSSSTSAEESTTSQSKQSAATSSSSKATSSSATADDDE